MAVKIQGTNSAAAPAVSNDGNDGLVVGTDTIDLSIGGAAKFKVGAAGQLGIGGATYGTSGHVLTSGGASAAPTWAAADSPMFAAGKVACINHQTTGTTGGGSTTSGAYNTVPWTHEIIDPGGIVSLSSNVITIGPGTYQMFANHLFYRVDSYVWGLKITSASGDHYWGTAGFAGNGDYDEQVAHCYCRHINDTGGDETMIAHYRCQTGQSDDGLGRGNSFGAGNVHGQWWILKEA